MSEPTAPGNGWIAGKCAGCGEAARTTAAACPSCGVTFLRDVPSSLARVLCLVCWVIAVGFCVTAKTDLQIAIGVAIGAGGVAWLAALRAPVLIKGRILTEQAK